MQSLVPPQQRLKRRRPRCERLEQRLMLTIGVLAEFRLNDVNEDGAVTASDALQIINYIASQRSNDAISAIIPAPPDRLDVNRDHRVSPFDALMVLNSIGQSIEPANSPTVTLTPDSVVEGDTLSILVQLGVPNPFPDSIFLRYSVADLTATAGEDYELPPIHPAFGTPVIAFPPGSSFATIDIPTQADLRVEGNEVLDVIAIDVQPPEAGYGISTPNVLGTIIDATAPYGVGPSNLPQEAPNNPSGLGISFNGLIGTTTCCCDCPDPSPELTGSKKQTGSPESVYLDSGEFYTEAIDLEVPGRGFNWRFQRKYRSGITSDGPLGHNWEFNYNRRIQEVTDGNKTAIQRRFPGADTGDVVRLDGNTRADLYTRNPDGSFTSPNGYYTRLIRETDGTYSERDARGDTVRYEQPNSDSVGQMTSLSDRNGNEMTFHYNSLDQLTHVVDTLGRQVDYRYDSNGHLIQVEDFFGRELNFTYDAQGDLVSVTSPSVVDTPNGNDFPDGKTIQYTYSGGFSDSRLNHNMLSITAPNEVAAGGNARVVLSYQTDTNSADVDRVLTQQLGGTNDSGVPAGGTISYQYQYLGVTVGADDFNTAVRQTTITERNGNVEIHQFNQLGNIVRVESQTNRNLRPSDPASFSWQYEYNRHGELLREIRPEGNEVLYDFDDANPDRVQQGNRNRTTYKADSDRGGDQSQIDHEQSFEPIYNQVAKSIDPRGLDAAYVPQNGGVQSEQRYTTQYIYDYQEGDNRTELATLLGLSESETQTLLDDAGISLNLGDQNGDGITNQVAGNLVAVVSPTVRLLSGSNQAIAEGDTSQEIVSQTVYNGFGQPTKTIDPEKNVTLYNYHGENDPDGDGTVTSAPADGRTLSSDTGGYLREITQDAESNNERNSNTDPPITQIRNRFRYDPVGNRTRVVDGRGIATDFVYNELNQVVQVVRAAEHNLLSTDLIATDSLTDFRYLERVFYDANDNVIRTQVEDRGDTSGVGGDQAVPGDADLDGGVGLGDFNIFRTEFGNSGNWFDGDFDGNGAVGLGDFNLFRTNFGATGSAPETVGGTAFVDTVYKYDIQDNTIEIAREVSDNEDLVTRYRYDANENRVLTILPAGNANSVVYDERDLVYQQTVGAHAPPVMALMAPVDPTDFDVRGGIASTTTFHYDGNRNVVETVDADDTDGSASNNSDREGAGDRTRFTYDGFDRRTSVIDSVGNQSVYQYDPVGNLIRQSHFGPVGGSSPTADGPDDLSLLQKVSQNGQIQTANLVSSNLLSATESLYDEISRSFQTEQILFVNTIPTQRTPDVADGATDLGKGDLSPTDNGTEIPGDDDDEIPGLAGVVSVIGRVSTRTEYDRNSRTTFLVEDDGDVHRSSYDGVNRVIKSEGPEGNVVRYAYDDNHNLIETQEVDVAQVSGVKDEIFLTTYFYDSLNRLDRAVDNLGQATDYRYDSRDNLVAKADAQGPLNGNTIARREFPDSEANANQQTVNTINDFGNVTLYFYDGINRMTREEIILTESGKGDGTHIGADEFGIKGDTPTADPDQGGGDGIIRVGYTYDANSLINSRIDDRGNVTLYLYDNLNRMVLETHGATVETTLNGSNLLGTRTIPTPTVGTINNPASISSTLIDQQLAATESSLDAVASLFPSQADQVDAPTTIVLGYDPDSNLLISEDENDSELFRRYDAINRPIAVRVFRSGQSDSHAGDPVFAPAPAADPPNSGTFPAVIGTTKQDFQYDGLSRPTRSTDNNDPGTTADDSITQMAYDSLSRVVEETQQIGTGSIQAIDSIWRSENLLKELIYPNGRTVDYTYDDLDRINEIHYDDDANQHVDYDYIGSGGRVLQRSYAENSTRLTYLDGTTDVGYDGLRRVVDLSHRRDGDDSIIVGFQHTYDRMNNRGSERKLHATGDSELYTYDSAYRLIEFDRGELNAAADAITTQSSNEPAQSVWVIDGANNHTSVDGASRNHTNFNEIASNEHDDNGNRTEDGTHRYRWDAFNRLRAVTRASDDATIAEYRYDAANRRVRKEVSNSGDLDGTTEFYYDGWQVLEERDGNNNLTQQYVYGNYIDEVLILDRNTNGNADSATDASDERLFYHQNSLYSVFGLTDSVATIVEGYQYDAYGQQTVFEPGNNGQVDFAGDDILTTEGESSHGNAYLYVARRVDFETGLYHYRNRQVDPNDGRFLNRDPLGVWHDDVNQGNGYAYVNNRPLNRLDPLGLEEEWFFSGRRVTTEDPKTIKEGRQFLNTFVNKEYLKDCGHCLLVTYLTTYRKKWIGSTTKREFLRMTEWHARQIRLIGDDLRMAIGALENAGNYEASSYAWEARSALLGFGASSTGVSNVPSVRNVVSKAASTSAMVALRIGQAGAKATQYEYQRATAKWEGVTQDYLHSALRRLNEIKFADDEDLYDSKWVTDKSKGRWQVIQPTRTILSMMMYPC
ncbi:MAG: hypothetical protein F9B45_05755 [Phycisphaera sp. RhM]|nr:hypothetical protein [Phycisphaera sp. RhM]